MEDVHFLDSIKNWFKSWVCDHIYNVIFFTDGRRDIVVLQCENCDSNLVFRINRMKEQK